MLKKALFIIGGIILIGGLYFLSIMYATGYFRSLEEIPFGKVYQEIPIAGAEDLTIAYDAGFMVISAFDRAGFLREENPTGGLYWMDLNQVPFQPIRLNDGLGEGFHPHGIGLSKLDSTTYRLLVVNHQNEKHTLEEFLLEQGNLTHIRTYDHELIVSPNDIIALDESRFYFTNDHKYTEGLGLVFENYLGLPLSNVVYFDGENFSEAASGIKYANGININQSKDTLFVAAPRAFEVRAYAVKDGLLAEPKVLDVETGVDNLEWDDIGNLWSGAHPNLLRFSAYAALKKQTAPSEIVKIKGGQCESVMVDKGDRVSGSSAALPYGDFLFVGNVMDDKLLVLKK